MGAFLIRWTRYFWAFFVMWDPTPGALNKDWYDFEAMWRYHDFTNEYYFNESRFELEIREFETEKEDSVRTDGKDAEDENAEKEVTPSTGANSLWHQTIHISYNG